MVLVTPASPDHARPTSRELVVAYADELTARDRIADAWQVRVSCQQTGSLYDFVLSELVTRRLLAFGEHKQRNRRSDDYETVMLDTGKFDALMRLSISHRVPIFFFNTFTDGLFYVNLTAPMRERVVDRPRRDGRARHNLVVDIPQTTMRRVTGDSPI